MHDTDERILDLLVQWEDQGRAPTPEQLCPDDLVLQEELRRRMAKRRRLHDLIDLPTLGENDGTPPASYPLIPGYVILEEIGRGGMGVVYKARHKSLDRLVALKMVLAGANAALQERARFYREAEAVARLQHPNIVQVYEVGEHEGCPYLALEYVDGGSLAQAVHSGRWAVGGKDRARQAAELIATLAQAVHSAHLRGVVHRDLKPANVLLARADDGMGEARSALGTLQAAIPKITDFGLAKRLDLAIDQTQSGAILGTPSYMAPEQAAGKPRAIGPATDVYALGAILYELLSGRPPFAGGTLLETLEQVRSLEPDPLTRLMPGVPGDLNTICLKCLEKEPERRYASAEELADDLRRYLNGELIQARGYTLADRVSRVLNRSEVVVQFSGLNTLLLPLAAPVPFLAHLAAFLLARSSPHYGAICAAVSVATVVGIMVCFLVAQWTGAFAPTRRNLLRFWSLRVGHLISMVLLLLTGYWVAAPGTWDVLTVYPQWTILAGALFFGLGSSYWGRFYVIGLFYLITAVVMALHLAWAPLEFGLILSITFMVTGQHVRRLKEENGTPE
jgi:serine/threonine protein kinase